MAETLNLGRVEVETAVLSERAERDLQRLVQKSRQAGKQTGEAFAGATEDLGGFEEGVKGAAQTVGGFVAMVATRGLNAMRGFVGWLGRGTAGLADLSARGALVAAGGLRTLAEATRDANGELSTMGKATAGVATGLETVAEVALTVSGVVLGTKVAVASLAAGLVVAGHRGAAEFNASFSRVLTLLDEIEARDLSRFKRNVSHMAGEAAKDARVVNDALYQVISAMPELAKETDRAMGVLRVALRASTGDAFTDASTAVEAITFSLNAFNMEAEQAERISDNLYMAQNQGVLTFGEVGAVIGRVADLASTLGMEYEELMTILAFRSQKGVKPAESVTELRAALLNIIKPSEQARAVAKELGIEFNTAALQAKGFTRFMDEIRQKTEGNTENLAALFGSAEAINLVNAMSKDMEGFVGLLDQFNNSAGTTEEIASELEDTWAEQKRVLASLTSNNLRQLGLSFEDVGATGLKAFNTIYQEVSKSIAGLLYLGEHIRDIQMELAKVAAMGPIGIPIRVYQWATGEEAEDPEAAAREEVQARLFGANRPLPRVDFSDVPAADLERLTGAVSGYTPTGPRIGAPPAPRFSRRQQEEPRAQSVGESVEKVTDLQRSLQLNAVAALAATGNMETYEDQVRKNAQAVNALVVEEMEHHRSRGVVAGSMNDLLDLYDTSIHKTKTLTAEERASRREREQAARTLLNLSAELEEVQRFQGADGTPFRTLEQMPSKLRAAVQGVVSVKREIADLEATIRTAGGSAAAPPEVLAALEAKREELARMQERAERIAADPANLVPDGIRVAQERVEGLTEAFRLLGSWGVASVSDVPEEFAALVGEVETVEGKIRELEESIRTVREEGGEVPADAIRLLEAYRQQREELARHADALVPIREILEDLPQLGADLFKDLDAEQIEVVQGALRELVAETNRAKEAERELQAARVAQDPGRIAAAEQFLEEARERVKKTTADLVPVLEEAGIRGEALARVLGLVEAEIGDVGVSLGENKRKWSEWARAADDIAMVVRGLSTLAGALGLVDKKTQQALEGFAELVEGGLKLAEGIATQNPTAIIAGAVSAVSGIIKVGQGLFGESEEDKAARTAMLDLVDALRSLEETILNDRSTNDVQEDRDAIGKAAGALQWQLDTFGKYGGGGKSALVAMAKELGIADEKDSKDASLEKLQRWAAEWDKKYGTNLAEFIKNGDAKGFLAALQELDATLGEKITEMGQFGDDVAGTIERVRYELELLGEVDAGEAIRSITRALLESTNSMGEFADELEELSGLDLTTEAGRRRRDEIIREMWARSQAGDVNFGDLTPDQFRDLMMQWSKATGDGTGIVGQGNEKIRMNMAGTEVQVSQLILQAQTQTHIQQAILNAITGGRMPTLGAFAPTLPSAAGGVSVSNVYHVAVSVPLPAGASTADTSAAQDFGRGMYQGFRAEAEAERIRAERRGQGVSVDYRVVTEPTM